MEQEDVRQPLPVVQPGGLPPVVGPTVELISKSLAALAIVLYGCGFLITSIHEFSYGFVETNPFRPRIASAGAWFILFMAIPLAIARGMLKHRHLWEGKEKWWQNTGAILYAYYVACMFFGPAFFWMFDFYVVPTWASPPSDMWKVALGLVAFLVLLVLCIWKRVPWYMSATASIILVGQYILYAANDLFLLGRFQFSAIWLWFFTIGIIALFEMRVRSWRPKLGDWAQTVFLILGALLIFASYYYPHIKSSWGGGAPIPITIYFTKDSTIMPNQSVGALLVDESDAGLYVVGKSDKRATFIPRSAIGMVYYSDDISGFSLAKPK
jgi:hypothetical protein